MKKLFVLFVGCLMLTGCGSKPDDFSGAIVTDESVELSVDNTDITEVQKDTSNATKEPEVIKSTDTTVYSVEINGTSITGTIEDLVASIPETNGVYTFSIYKDNSESHYVTDAYNVRNAIMEFIKEAEENTEPEVDYMPAAVEYATYYEGALDSLGNYNIWAARINDPESPYFAATEIVLETSNGELYRYTLDALVPLKEYENSKSFGHDKESMYEFIEEYNNNPNERPSLWIIFE